MARSRQTVSKTDEAASKKVFADAKIRRHHVIFGEVVYAVFLLATVFLYWLVPLRARLFIVAGSGICFYAYYAGWAVGLLGILTVASWLSLYAHPSQRQPTAIASDSEEVRSSPPGSGSILIWVGIFVAVLVYFKYANFLSGIFGGPKMRTIAPLAISFFIFEFIHVACEYRRGTLKSVPLVEYLAFIFFFPTMVAGPIKRYGQFDEQLQQAQFSANHMLEGFFRIVIGLFKKMVIADNLSTIIQEIGSPDKTRSVVMLSVAVFLYGFRIYFDFSGYSDIAIGSARLFGIRVPENFLHPYRQSNISAFWRSWHVSLYSWLIDYVFIPLGGSRAGFFRALANIMIVMLVSGLWHGAAWNFVLWGFWHGMLLVIHKIYAEKIKPALDLKLLSGRGALAASYTLTMAGVWFGWLLFMWPLHDGANYMKLAYNSLF